MQNGNDTRKYWPVKFFALYATGVGLVGLIVRRGQRGFGALCVFILWTTNFSHDDYPPGWLLEQKRDGPPRYPWVVFSRKK